eukprot:11072522-Alexandrium_andersonii.AAC.1
MGASSASTSQPWSDRPTAAADAASARWSAASSMARGLSRDSSFGTGRLTPSAGAAAASRADPPTLGSGCGRSRPAGEWASATDGAGTDWSAPSVALADDRGVP